MKILTQEFKASLTNTKSKPSVVYQVLIASPSDVTEEREAISKAIHSWNAANSRDLKTVLLPIRWETHATPEMGDRPQAMLNKQLVNPSDILVGVFWTRIGTDTGVSESGTIEEIEEFVRADKHVLAYFSSKSIPHDVDLIQLEKVRRFRTKITQLGLFDSFSSTSELENKLDRHLTEVVRRLKSRTLPGTTPNNVDPEVREKTSSNPPEPLDKQMLGKLKNALHTDEERLVLLTFLHQSAAAKPKGTNLEMHSKEIIKIANEIAQENGLEQIKPQGIGGVLSGFMQPGELEELKILCKGRQVGRGTIYSINVKREVVALYSPHSR